MSYEERAASKLNQVFYQVKSILREHPETRNNDTLLICKWLETYVGASTLQDIKSHAKEISFESVRRARQKIQAAGEYLPTEETVINRRRLQEVYAAVMTKEVSDI